MKKIIYFVIVVSALFFISCKKESNTNSGGSGTSSGTSSSISGYLRAIRSFGVNTGTSSLYITGNYGTAYFFSNPLSYTSQVAAGNVYASSTKFSYQSALKTYNDTTYMLNLNPTAWQVTGAGVIPAFSYTNNDSLPGYTAFMSLPDTIYKNQTLNIPVNGVSNANSIEILLIDGMTGAMTSKLLTVVSANNTISISASAMSSFNVSTSSPSGSMRVVFQKYNDQAFSGKTFRFISEKEIDKNVFIK